MTLNMKLNELRNLIPDPKKGLGDDLFHFISSLTPMVNVDLLIRNDKNETLLTWRHDKFHGPGWHIPGGIIRFKETIEERLAQVAFQELKVKISHQKKPILVETMLNNERDIRGHFISLLYECKLKTALDPSMLFNSKKNVVGHWQWHNVCPDNIIKVQRRFKKYIDGDYE